MKHKKKQSGFTLIELLIVTALIGFLISSGIYFIDISGKRKSIEDSAIRFNLMRNFPSAIVQVYQSELTLEHLTNSKMIATREVSIGKPIGWTVNSPTENTVRINFTLDNDTDATALASFLNNKSDTTLVSTATSSGKIVAVTYAL